MANKETDTGNGFLSSGTATAQLADTLEAQAVGKTMRKILEQRTRRKRQMSIMGAKQSITFSLRRRYVERARIVAEYLGISMSTYIERCINKDNVRYQRVINALGQEIRRHDDVIGRLDNAAKNVDLNLEEEMTAEDDLMKAISGIKSGAEMDDDLDAELEE